MGLLPHGNYESSRYVLTYLKSRAIVSSSLVGRRALKERQRSPNSSSRHRQFVFYPRGGGGRRSETLWSKAAAAAAKNLLYPRISWDLKQAQEAFCCFCYRRHRHHLGLVAVVVSLVSVSCVPHSPHIQETRGFPHERVWKELFLSSSSSGWRWWRRRWMRRLYCEKS